MDPNGDGEPLGELVVRVDEAVARPVAAGCCELLWQEMGRSPSDRAGWAHPVVRTGPRFDAPFREAVKGPRLAAALDRLVGVGRWSPFIGLGASIVVRFPVGGDPGDTGWHVDASFAPDQAATPGGAPVADGYLEWRVPTALIVTEARPWARRHRGARLDPASGRTLVAMHRYPAILLALSAAVGCGDPAPFAPVGIDPPRRDAGSAEAETDAAAPQADGGGPAVASFDPRHVYLDGTFNEGACGSVAYEDFDATTPPLAGGDCRGHHHVVTNDGRVLYIDVEGQLRRFVADRWTVGARGRVQDPMDPLANDPVLPTPGCARAGLLRVDPVTDRYLYACGSMASDGIFDEGGSRRPALDETRNLWPGYGHDLVTNALHRLYVLTGEDAVPVDDASLPDARSLGNQIRSVRAREDGFRMLYVDELDDALHLAHVAFDGAATLVGTYPPAPEGYSWHQVTCRLDAEGRAFCIGSGEPAVDVVLRFSIDESEAVIVHDEARDPTVKLHGSRLFTGP